jgi:molybdopterin molybdotransferase
VNNTPRTHTDCCSGAAISVNEADQLIADCLSDYGEETCTLADSKGRVLSRSVKSDRDQPPFDRVAMDGIAIEFADWEKGQRRFPVEAIHQAGACPPASKESGSCFEVMTGAVLPDSCNCVIPYELTSQQGNEIIVSEEASPRRLQHIHQKGTDQSQGSTVLASGSRIGPAEVAIAASMGAVSLTVYRQPTISLITNGDELVPVNTTPEPWQIRQSNRPAATAALNNFGYSIGLSMHLPDEETAIMKALKQALEQNDVIIIGGGVSKGKYDYVPHCLTKLGMQKIFHHIRQRPGKPMWFGKGSEGQLVFALPGNPVSFLICLYRYVIPALMTATHKSPFHIAQAVLTEDIAVSHGLTAFCPVQTTVDSRGLIHAVPKQTKGSGDFCGLAQTSGFVELKEGVSNHPAGLAVPYYEWQA